MSDYEGLWPALPGVISDIKSVKEIHELLGFSVETIMHPTREELNETYVSFIDRFGHAEKNRFLFYFAGHRNTIVPQYGGTKSGEIESVLEIGEFLGLPAEERNPNNRIMILEKENVHSEILALSVLNIVDIKKSQIRDAGSTLYHDFKDWIAGELDYDNQTVTILNSLNVLRKTIPH